MAYWIRLYKTMELSKATNLMENEVLVVNACDDIGYAFVMFKTLANCDYFNL